MPARLWSTEPKPLPGRVLAGRYRVGAPLGHGGAADVHEAFDLRLGRAVAVKLFRSGGAQTEERFSEEALLLARLQHPGLVTVYDFGRDGDLPFLVLQLVRGATLRARIAEGALAPAAVCALGADLATTLAHVHAAGVVHRDVKPSNILLDESGAPHLTDFGISRLSDDTARTTTGVLVGTAAYLAPEQVSGGEAGPAADVYALGLTLLECLKGELEYPGAPLEAAMARLHREPAVPPALDEELAGLLTAMTAREEHERPDARTCAEVLTALSPAGTPTGRHDIRGAGEGAGGSSAEKAVGAVLARLARPAPATAAHGGPAVRRPGRRTFTAAGAALAALLGMTLTASVGDSPDAGADSAAGARPPGTAAPSTEPSDAPSAPAGAATGQEAVARREPARGAVPQSRPSSTPAPDPAPEDGGSGERPTKSGKGNGSGTGSNGSGAFGADSGTKKAKGTARAEEAGGRGAQQGGGHGR